MSERFIAVMMCDICKNRNYHFTKNKKQEKNLDLKKFCKNCRKTTKHKETK
ncbi:MAG: 50S ribosomal protein L33 [Endomicrobium sp.]|jgi:large subunit ribosomal protein L33|nr:50S ribosomal protein L33 [Endomicrobium sp.]